MAGSYRTIENGWPVHKSMIRASLSEKIGKMFKIVHAKPDLNGRICTPVFILYTTKYDTRMVCKLLDTEEYLPIFCNQLVSYPLVIKSPLPACSMETPDLSVEEIRKFLNTAAGICDKKAPEWARREMVKSMLLGKSFPPFPCNHMPIFNKSLFSRSLIICYQTEIKVRGGCPYDGFVDFKRFGEGICLNDRCFYCSNGEVGWYYGRKHKIEAKFLEFLRTGLCNFCILQKMKEEKEEHYGGLVKFAKKVLDGPYGQASQTNAEEDDDDESDYSISSEESDYDNLEYWEDDKFSDPPLFSYYPTSL